MFRSQLTYELKYQEVIVKVLVKVPKMLYRKAKSCDIVNCCSTIFTTELSK